MKPLKRKPRLEKEIENALRKALKKAGWHTWKTHGNRFQAGFPDLYCLHPIHGQRWIEVKRPKTGRLTAPQVAQFELFESFGVGVWVLDSESTTGLLGASPNWRDFLTKSQQSMLG